MTQTPIELRAQAKKLEDQAWEIDREEARKDKSYMVGENIRDGRPLVSGPYTWDEAAKYCHAVPQGVRFICDYGSPLP